MIYDQTKITPQTILVHFNTQHKDLKYTINVETDNQITYIDFNLSNKRGKIEMEVYRKPTTTDVTINNTSCHPKEHKLATFKTGYIGSLYYSSMKIKKK
jgi:hypothetical protein